MIFRTQKWYKIVERGLRLGLMDTVDKAGIFQNDKLVLNGGMGVPKLKRLLDGSTVELQRFISNLVPMNAYFRRLRGDSLPPVSRLGLIVLDEGETLEIDLEDVESAFNLFRMPPVWKSFFAYSKKVPCPVYSGGDPNKWVCVSITTVPMGWVGAVDLIQHIARRLVFNIAGVPRASEVSSAGSFPPHLIGGLFPTPP